LEREDLALYFQQQRNNSRPAGIGKKNLKCYPYFELIFFLVDVLCVDLLITYLSIQVGASRVTLGTGYDSSYVTAKRTTGTVLYMERYWSQTKIVYWLSDLFSYALFFRMTKITTKSLKFANST
jgi:hypothetical protein